MCGIAGIYKFNSPMMHGDTAAVHRMIDAQAHRGPDGEGVIALNPFHLSPPPASHPSAVLGHCRLSVIDLSDAGRQPMSNEKGTVWITYNGEIYNFRALRHELSGKGHTFQSQTDTEVIVHGYEEWGIDRLLQRLRGMFAFALYDTRPSRLILARDRFGIKPLYYYQDRERIIFASEVRAIMKSRMISDEKNLEALVRFLQIGSIPVPQTTVKDVLALPAGHYLVADEGGIHLKSYRDLSSYLHPSPKVSTSLNRAHPNDHITTTRSLLEEAINLHLTSDVPLGVFLSGGIDSSALVALASRFRNKPLTTLSIVFDEADYSEAQYARRMAREYKTDHHQVLVGSKDFFEALPQIFAAMDQPTVDGVNTYFVSKAAKEAGLTVVLSGVGGDEVFLGYNHFRKAVSLDGSLQIFAGLPSGIRRCLVNMAMKAGSLAGKSRLEKLAYLEDASREGAYLLFRGLFTPNQIKKLLGVSEKEFDSFGSISKTLNIPISQSSNLQANPSLLDSFMDLEFYHYLQNQLLKDTDFMSMAHSIEIRVPFLDHHLVEYVAGVPAGAKLNSEMNKPLLVKALGNSLPKEIWDRSKMGFTFPFAKWIKERSDELQAKSLEHRFLDRRAVKDIWRGFREGHLHWSRPWAMVVASQWFSS